MGWFNEDSRHEGYVVGLVVDEADFTYKAESAGGATYLRELTYVVDHDREVPKGGLAVSCFQVACECGWRSRRFVAPYRARWIPFALHLQDEELEDAARAEWHRHVQLEERREVEVSGGRRVPRLVPAP